MIKVVVLGSGNVATHLCIALKEQPNISLIQNYNRKGEKIDNCIVPVTNDKYNIAKSDIYIFSLSDNSLYSIEKEFSHLNGLIAHTSGSTPLSALSNFVRSGVFYPLQTLKKHIPVDFSTIPIVIEANNKNDEKLLIQLAKSISKTVQVLNSEQRNSLHVAAVFANNFSNFMLCQAEDICRKNNINFSLLKPLINETVEKMLKASPKENQTGPAIRRDTKTIERHIATITDKKQIKLYKQLTAAIQNYYE